MFGVNAAAAYQSQCVGLGTLLGIADIKAYKPAGHSMSSGQVLTGAVGFDSARLIVREMADTLSLDLVAKGVKGRPYGVDGRLRYRQS